MTPTLEALGLDRPPVDDRLALHRRSLFLLGSLAIALGGLLGCGGLFVIPGISDTGPFYAVAEVYPSMDKPMVRLKKMWMPSQTDQISRTANYVAPVTFPDGTTQGQAQLGSPVQLEDDGEAFYSRIVPARGTSRFIQVQDQFKTRTTVFLIDSRDGKKTTLASFPGDFDDAADGACAVTRSGAALLLVSPGSITLRDIKQNRESAVDAGPLLALRSAMIQKRGNPGEWWLTDDQRYIVVEPSQEIWTRHGETSSEPMPMTIGETRVDIHSEGVIFDRQTRQLSTFPAAAGPSPTRSTRLFDVENVNGKLVLLYVGDGQPIGGITAVLTDASGRPQASHTIQSPTFAFAVHFAGWDPTRETIWFQTRDARIDLPDFAPGAAQHLVAWDASKNSERRYDLTVAQIENCVSKR